MHTLRLLLYFVLGVFLSAIVTLSYAVETMPSITGSTSRSTDTGCPVTGATVADVCAQAQSCSSIGGHSLAYWNGSLVPMLANADNPYQGFCMDATSTVSAMQVAEVGGVKTCPDSSWTLSSDQTTCTRADTCVAADLGAAYYKLPISSPDASGTYCEGGCEVTLSGIVPMNGDPNPPASYDDGVSIWKWYGKSRGTTTCTSSNASPSPITGSPTDPVKSPPCATGEGVLTSSTGKVYCVPSTTSTTKPIVNSSSKTDTYDDGSTTTTNITQTCTGAGACSTTTTTTNTAAAGGGTGKAGTPGTTTSTKDDKPSDTSEFCAKNPNLQMCKGGMAEEGTQKQVLAEVKKLSTVDAETDKSAIANTSNYAETPGYQAAKDADDNLVKYASGVTKNADVEASKTTFEQALSSGFWTDIPTASCTTPTYVIAGHEIEWDRWCEIVGYIQDVGAYGMWIMLAISVFVMLTGGRQS